MPGTDELLVEDWQGLESELERLFIAYGIPRNESDDLSLLPIEESYDATREP